MGRIAIPVSGGGTVKTVNSDAISYSFTASSSPAYQTITRTMTVPSGAQIKGVFVGNGTTMNNSRGTHNQGVNIVSFSQSGTTLSVTIKVQGGGLSSFSATNTYSIILTAIY